MLVVCFCAFCVSIPISLLAKPLWQLLLLFGSQQPFQPRHGVLERYPELLLGSYPYFDNPVYSIKLTLESKDVVYLDGAYEVLLSELAKVRLNPVNL